MLAHATLDSEDPGRSGCSRCRARPIYVTRYAINSWGILYLQEDARLLAASRRASLLDDQHAGGHRRLPLYGFISDKLFAARRPPANLLFAITEIAGPRCSSSSGRTNSVALTAGFILFGVGLTGLVTSLGGLFAVDICPKRVAGAAMGVVGIFSYIGAAIQENISGHLIERGMTMVVDGAPLRLQHRHLVLARLIDRFDAARRQPVARQTPRLRYPCPATTTSSPSAPTPRTPSSPPQDTRYVDGGGYSYAAHAATLAGLQVAALTRLAAEDRKSTECACAKRESKCEIIESRASTLMRLEYPTANVDERSPHRRGGRRPFRTRARA